jgi:hypothetical protein
MDRLDKRDYSVVLGLPGRARMTLQAASGFGEIKLC